MSMDPNAATTQLNENLVCNGNDVIENDVDDDSHLKQPAVDTTCNKEDQVSTDLG